MIFPLLFEENNASELEHLLCFYQIQLTMLKYHVQCVALEIAVPQPLPLVAE